MLLPRTNITDRDSGVADGGRELFDRTSKRGIEREIAFEDG
jgi:hypothetical protein